MHALPLLSLFHRSEIKPLPLFFSIFPLIKIIHLLLGGLEESLTLVLDKVWPPPVGVVILSNVCGIQYLCICQLTVSADSHTAVPKSVKRFVLENLVSPG